MNSRAVWSWRLSVFVLLTVGCGALGCTESREPVVIVELYTDLVGGAEFTNVVSDVQRFEGGALGAETIAALPELRFVDGVRVAEFPGLPSGRYLIGVNLVRDDGSVVASRVVDLLIDGSRSVAVVIARSCENVTCGDNQTCASGVCVDRACSQDNPEACSGVVGMCSGPDDCDAPLATCAQPVCRRGTCLAAPRVAPDEGACTVEGQYCDPRSGCSDYPAGGDAGVGLDAGVDAGEPDGGTAVPVAPLIPATGTWRGRVEGTATGPSTGRPKFYWSEGQLADGSRPAQYRLQISDDLSFSSPRVDLTQTTRTYILSSSEVLQPRKWYWRVAACSATGDCEPFGATAYFWEGHVRGAVVGARSEVATAVFGSPVSGQTGAMALHEGEAVAVSFSSGSFERDVTHFVPRSSGPPAASRFAQSLAAGDFNGDGVAELVVGAPGDGRVFVFAHLGSVSGMPEVSQTLTWMGAPMGSSFGHVVMVPGDLNGDGFDELVVGVPVIAEGGSMGTGHALVFWGGATGGLGAPTVLTGEHPTDEFGASLGAIGDVNGDGFVDFAVGARSADRRGERTGEVYVYFGGRDSADDRALEESRARLRAPDAAVLGAQFGFSIAAAGDLNHDGYADMAIGAPGAASVWIYLGGSDGPATARLRLRSPESSGMDGFGYALAGGADLNGDGHADLVVGAPSGATTGGFEDGIVYVYLGSGDRMSLFGSPLQLPSGPAAAGTCLGLRDYTGDGLADIMVGAPEEESSPGSGVQTGLVEIYQGSRVVSASAVPTPASGGRIFGSSSVTRESTFVTGFGTSCL